MAKKSKKLVRSQVAHERCIDRLKRKRSSAKIRGKMIYHNDVLERQEYSGRVLRREERRKIYREAQREASRKAVRKQR